MALPLLEEIRACRVCADALPHEPRPVLSFGPRARVVIIGQAPGARVHASGVPWDDASGDTLREWMGIECAPTWHPRVLEQIDAGLTLLLGQYAQARYLGDRRGSTLTETVRQWRAYGTGVLPLPHPSPRNNRWQAKNPWFLRELVPVLRRRLTRLGVRAAKR